MILRERWALRVSAESIDQGFAYSHGILTLLWHALVAALQVLLPKLKVPMARQASPSGFAPYCPEGDATFILCRRQL